jgi:hypothetical protein
LAVDPALVSHAETGQVPVGMQVVQAIAAVRTGGSWWRATARCRFSSGTGRWLQAIAVPGEPRCLAVAGDDHDFPGRIYVGLTGRVEVFDAAGQPVGSWSKGWTNAAC